MEANFVKQFLMISMVIHIENTESVIILTNTCAQALNTMQDLIKPDAKRQVFLDDSLKIAWSLGIIFLLFMF